MAKLAPYTGGENGSLAVPGVPSVPNSGAAIGAGLDDLSKSLNRVTAYMLDDQRKADERTLAEAKSDQALLVHGDQQSFQTYAAQQIQQQTEAAGVEGFGIAENTRKALVEEAQRRVNEKFPLGATDPKVTSGYNAIIEANTRVAMSQENDIRVKWRAAQIGDTVNSLSATVAANPTTYGAAKKEFDDFIDNKVYTASPKAKEDLRADGTARLQRATAEGVFQRNGGRDAVKAFDGVVVNTPRQIEAPQAVKDIISAADRAGYSGNKIAAISKLESNLNPNEGKDPNSSAFGLLKVMSGDDPEAVSVRASLGLTKEDVLNRDNPKVAEALSHYLMRESDKLKSAGITPTPGTDYMIWNVGPAGAKAIMRANPNEDVGDVLRRTWAPYKSPGWIETALHNNPGMYKPGQSIAQVRDNYEGKMAGAMKSTEYLVTGATSLKSDEQVQAVLSQIMPAGSFDKLTMGDVGPMYAKAKAAQKVASEQELRGVYAQGVLAGKIPPMAYDDNYRKAITEAFAPAAQQIHSALSSGDPQEYATARALAETTHFLPPAYTTSLREVMLTGSPEVKGLAYKLLSDLETQNHNAYTASKIDDESAARVKEYRSFTQFMNVTPGQAIQRIEFNRQGDGKIAREMLADALDGSKNKKGELEGINWGTVTKSFSPGWFESAATAVTPVQQGAIVKAMQDAYAFYRTSNGGREPDEAMALAMDDIRKGWGVSQTAGTKNLMPHPPEKYFGEVAGSYDWIKTGAQDQIANYGVVTGLIKLIPSATAAGGLVNAPNAPNSNATLTRPPSERLADAIEPGKLEYRIIPDARTNDDVNSKRTPTYLLAFKVPNKDGVMITHVLPERFDPAQAYQNALFADTVKNTMAGNDIAQNKQLNEQANQRVLQRTPRSQPPLP